MHNKKIVAKRLKTKLSWEKLPNIETYKKSYQRTPEKFVEENNILYLLQLDKSRLNQSFSASLKISGSLYALVLILTKGDKGKEFRTHYTYLSKHKFKQHGERYIALFEGIVKQFGVYVGETSDDGVNWFEAGDFPVKLQRIKTLYINHPDEFYTVGNKIYYLRCIQSVVEDMFFSAVAIAGGEYALASALSTDAKTRQNHLMNFKRLGFKQTKTFTLYANLFSDYLMRHKSLFEVNDNE